MNAARTLLILSVAALLSACAAPAHQHAAAGATAAGAVSPMASMESRMKAMHEMHQKMKNAKTPAERQALMADHMKAMQGGMAMMKEMHAKPGGGGTACMQGTSGPPAAGDGKGMPADMAKRHQMMGDHMAMMDMMMQMMSDRMSSHGAAH